MVLYDMASSSFRIFTSYYVKGNGLFGVFCMCGTSMCVFFVNLGKGKAQPPFKFKYVLRGASLSMSLGRCVVRGKSGQNNGL